MAKPKYSSFGVSVLEDGSYKVVVNVTSRGVQADFRVSLPPRGTRTRRWNPSQPEYKHHLQSLERLQEQALLAIQRFCADISATPH